MTENRGPPGTVPRLMDRRAERDALGGLVNAVRSGEAVGYANWVAAILYHSLGQFEQALAAATQSSQDAARKSRIMPLRILPNRSRQCCQSSCAVARSCQLALNGACPPVRGAVWRGQLRGRPARARASPRAWGGAAVICALSQTRVIQGAGQGLRPGI